MIGSSLFKWPIIDLLYRYRGIEVTVIPEKIYIRIGSPKLEFMDKALRGPSNDCLACKGRFMGHLQKDKITIEEKIYVIKNLHKLLLGRPAITASKLLSRIGSVRRTSGIGY